MARVPTRRYRADHQYGSGPISARIAARKSLRVAADIAGQVRPALDAMAADREEAAEFRAAAVWARNLADCLARKEPRE